MAEKILHENPVNDEDDLSRVEPGTSTGTTAQSANGLSAHMPGPWHVTVNGGFVKGIPSASVWIDAIEFYSVACVMPQREVEANARLIAAAPDMFAACKNVLACCALEDISLAAYEPLRAAIAKAEGAQ